MPIKDHNDSYRTVNGVLFTCIADRKTEVAEAMAEQIRAWGYRARLVPMHDGSAMRRLLVEDARADDICRRLELEGDRRWQG